MQFDDLEKHFEREISGYNQRAMDDFEGYSPAEMQYILYDPLGDMSPVEIIRMPDEEYKKIPMLNQVKYLASVVGKGDGLKLTKLGFLPVKVVADIYSQGYLKDELIEDGIYKLYKETDSITIRLARILAEISGLVKVRKNVMSLTRAGEKMLRDDHSVLLKLLEVFLMKYNWAYFDGYGQNNIGRLGAAFTFILLSKYGDKKRIDRFYADKYMRAFPALVYEVEGDHFSTPEDFLSRCYSTRTFERFLYFFGLVDIDPRGILEPRYIQKTELFDILIKCKPHNPEIK
ncbi:MAG: hypothetical protein U9N72_05025 [Bacteroidota bacterium]|nr:hypothetical protein [Bacteroidota bacterium]